MVTDLDYILWKNVFKIELDIRGLSSQHFWFKIFLSCDFI